MASDQSVRTAYDPVAATYASTIPGLSAESPLEVAFLDRFADEVAATGGRVADVGCGPGRITAYLASRGANVFGLDLSPQMIEVASVSYPDLLFEVGTMTGLPSGDGELAGVLAWYSTIHTPLDELDAVFAEFARVLQPGGALLIGRQVGSEVVHITRSYGHDVDVDLHLVPIATIAELLVAAGFTTDAVLSREPVGREPRQQGFVLAHKA
jgi:ubiquinone/menaquinone biosynthesis C-methylase UbiE